MMVLKRLYQNEDETLGQLYYKGKLICWTLEDQHQTTKIYGETRIDEGEYLIKLRTAGRIHEKYINRYGSEFHKGVLHLQDVPNFTWVYIHTGTDDDDTLGCILVGESTSIGITGKITLGGSRSAYKRLYSQVIQNIDTLKINII